MYLHVSLVVGYPGILQPGAGGGTLGISPFDSSLVGLDGGNFDMNRRRCLDGNGLWSPEDMAQVFVKFSAGCNLAIDGQHS